MPPLGFSRDRGSRPPTLTYAFSGRGGVALDLDGVGLELPDAEVCFDPFHVVALASRAVDDVRRGEWNAKGKSTTTDGPWVKHPRWSLLNAPERQSHRQLARLAEVERTNQLLYRAFLLKEELRLIYHLPDRALAPEHLRAWLAWASRSKLKPFVKLARTIREHADGILAAIRLGLSNARLCSTPRSA